MSTHIVQFGKHRFVCGLFWQSLSRPRELRKEAIELARTINLDLMVIRKDQGSAQAGYAHTADGAAIGMLSLGAAIAQNIASKGIFIDGRHQSVNNWLGAFKLPDGKWAYFAMRDESFLPDGDFAGTREEVLERLNGDYGLGGWNIILGDKELEGQGFHNFVEERIENLLPKSRGGRIKVQRWWALAPVERHLTWKHAAIAAAAVAVTAAGVVGWQIYQKQQKEAQEREAAMEAARNKLANGEIGEPRRPWPAKPKPAELARACVERFKELTPGGWNLEEYSCDAAQTSYKWTRGDSTVANLLGAVPNAVVELNGDKASYWEPLKLQGSEDEELEQAKPLLMSLLSRFQALGLDLDITSVPPPPPPPNADKNAIPKPSWQTFNLKLKSQGVPPGQIATELSQAGVRLEKLSYRSGEWLIEGVIYAK